VPTKVGRPPGCKSDPLLANSRDLWGIIVLFRTAILAVGLLVAASMAYAEKRVALVIGNKDYKASVGPLANPLNDIRLVGDALKSVGFEVLKPVENATRNDMLTAIYGFASALRDAGPEAVGFLYYSGHGLESAGENYLVPVDVAEPSTRQLRIQGVKQGEILDILRAEAPNAAHYLVLDACRNNLQGARGGKGFVAMGQQNGVLVAFSTEPGRTASDTGAASGPYAAALATELVKPGQNDLLMFHNVRVDVMDKTKGDQVPWTEDGIQRRERPIFANATPDAGKPPQGPPVVTQQMSSEAAQVWSVVQNTTSTAVLEDFKRQFSATPYGSLARARLEELKQASAAEAAARPNLAAEAKAAEAVRLKAEKESKAAAEAERARAEKEAKAAAEGERARVEREAKAAAETARIKAEQDARAAAEAARIKAEATKTAEAQQPQNLAALTSIDQAAKSAPLPASEVVRQLQTELRRVGCFTFEINGEWNANSRSAVELFNKYGHMNLDAKEASLDALELLRSKASRICPVTCQHGFHVENDRCVEMKCKAGFVIGDDGSCERAREKPAHQARPEPKPAAPSNEASAAKGSSSGPVVCDTGGCRQLPAGCKPTQNAGFLSRNPTTCQ
jgi:uncharacterized caspase-like protein